MTPTIAHTPIYQVYRHIRPDKDEVFYIGIGGEKRSAKPYNRNKYWHNIYNLNNKQIEIDILFDGLTWEQACQKEIEFIKLYGRWDKGLGTLVNLTDGGDGMVGFIMSEDQKQKIAKANEGNLSNTGKYVINNGIEEKFIDSPLPVPDGWRKGRAKSHSWNLQSRQLISGQRKGRKLNIDKEKRSAAHIGNSGSSGNFWINDGITSIYMKVGETIPDGWKRGRIRTWKITPPPKNTGKVFITDGECSKYITCGESIPDGWYKGLTIKNGKNSNYKQLITTK